MLACHTKLPKTSKDQKCRPQENTKVAIPKDGYPAILIHGTSNQQWEPMLRVLIISVMDADGLHQNCWPLTAGHICWKRSASCVRFFSHKQSWIQALCCCPKLITSAPACSRKQDGTGSSKYHHNSFHKKVQYHCITPRHLTYKCCPIPDAGHAWTCCKFNCQLTQLSSAPGRLPSSSPSSIVGLALPYYTMFCRDLEG